ncbi:hypothetical protein B0T19DRAFT_403608 [Cercophora scortea]|uniref:RING-CH-type domain-containing protein n=1 Tax=Cercophora scortea TaxID=314031 RepID=A0AAE0I9F0_9PEZI|nr:hypothetical protein B0T19DRAFT_403608 [Cercophora scortea]
MDVPNDDYPSHPSSSSSPADAHHQPGAPGAFPPPSDANPPHPTHQRRRRYKPRTCRICLEVVQPSTEIDDSAIGSVAGMFSSKPRVQYISEDPESGRLLSPCKCKGSQKYVHEGCLQAWRLSAPMSERNFWKCPTCHFEYRMQRLRWGRWITSKLTRVVLTGLILLVTVFILGFIADPIINLWVDPVASIVDSFSDIAEDIKIASETEDDSWSFHFVKGFLSLGLLGFLKSFFVMSPWNWFQIRGGALGRRRGTGRDRIESINWAVVILGIITFLGATWKLVSHFSARALEKASETVVDIQADDSDEEESEDEGDGIPGPEIPARESRKDR